MRPAVKETAKGFKLKLSLSVTNQPHLPLRRDYHGTLLAWPRQGLYPTPTLATPLQGATPAHQATLLLTYFRR